MRVYSHPACLAHVPGAGHPECPARLDAVAGALRAALPKLDWQLAPAATREQIGRVHSAELIATVLDTVVSETIRLDADTALSPDSAEAALRAAGAGTAAVDWVLAGKHRRAFCAVRPPGHHATQRTAMGFCLFNSIAIAAAHALKAHGLERVSIVDFDVHHGNGTQDIFQRDRRVQYLSSHQIPLYPGTGRSDEHGVGNIHNAELPPGSGAAVFRAVWTNTLLPQLATFEPQLLLISAGFDAHHLDPLADLKLEAADFHWLSSELAALADAHCQGRVVSMLEGGYSLTALRECSVAHLQGLARAASTQ
ncbi:MAG TPA: histone deacetylase family protein [Arenimonas sp.]|uniref:histone deacetylase family protein n=1 Tax=Arenimonas sp. TaxID=1872635 RepID=UPI002BE202CF|nr:histone deacetylase family protein [Arenimonas sp.]HMB56144.1 histone deacetylase family protein [Arenimonas sp.]